MKIVSLAALLFFSYIVSAQTPIEVYNRSFRIGSVSEDTLYFSFAKGDQIIVDFESIGRELKEFEVLQYKGASLFREDDKTKISGKKLSIETTSVYTFRLANRSGTERTVKLHIRRIPGSSATKNFTTSVKWKFLNDTVYSDITEKTVARKDTVIVNRESILSVYGTQNPKGNTQCPEFDIPGKTIAWSYYVGVNQPGLRAFQEATQKLPASPQSSLPGYGPLGAFALTGKSNFAQLQNDQTITYSIVDPTNAALAKQEQPFKSIRSKKVSNDFSVMKEPREGKLFFYLNNDGAFDVDVIVKIAAVVVYERMKDKSGQKMEILTRKIPMVASANKP